MRKTVAKQPKPMSIRISPAYEDLLGQFAEREGIALGTLVRRVLEQYVRQQLRERFAQCVETAEIKEWSDAAAADMATLPA